MRVEWITEAHRQIWILDSDVEECFFRVFARQATVIKEGGENVQTDN